MDLVAYLFKFSLISEYSGGLAEVKESSCVVFIGGRAEAEFQSTGKFWPGAEHVVSFQVFVPRKGITGEVEDGQWNTLGERYGIILEIVIILKEPIERVRTIKIGKVDLEWSGLVVVVGWRWGWWWWWSLIDVIGGKNGYEVVDSFRLVGHVGGLHGKLVCNGVKACGCGSG